MCDFYYMPMSPPCRAVRMTAKAVGVDLNLILANPMAGETVTPEFLKMNIQHTVPTLDDKGFCLNESRAICQYLVNRYAEDDSLYPHDPRQRAKVDMKLYFDMGTLFPRFVDAYLSVVVRGAEMNQDHMEKLDEALGYLEAYLKAGCVAGSTWTIADFAVLATLSTIEAGGHDLSHFPKVMTYLQRAKVELEGYEEAIQEGADAFGAFAKPILKKASEGQGLLQKICGTINP